MIKLPNKGNAGDELNWTWLNLLRTAVKKSIVNLGPNSGLSMIQNDAGTFLRVSASINQVFICQPSSPVTGATGAWPTITPEDFRADIYVVAGKTMALFDPDSVIYNWYAASLVANKTCYVVPDGSGSYVVVTQSCT